MPRSQIVDRVVSQRSDANAVSDDDDAEYYRQEVGEEPEPELFSRTNKGGSDRGAGGKRWQNKGKPKGGFGKRDGPGKKPFKGGKESGKGSFKGKKDGQEKASFKGSKRPADGHAGERCVSRSLLASMGLLIDCKMHNMIYITLEPWAVLLSQAEAAKSLRAAGRAGAAQGQVRRKCLALFARSPGAGNNRTRQTIFNYICYCTLRPGPWNGPNVKHATHIVGSSVDYSVERLVSFACSRTLNRNEYRHPQIIQS